VTATGQHALLNALPHPATTALEAYRELLLGNLVMLGEIPAPTFGEQDRIEFLKQRLTECGLQNVCSDGLGNGLGILPGAGGGGSILLAAHADTPFQATVPHTISVYQDGVRGPGVADNSLGLATLATLPTVLERLQIRLNSDVVVMGSIRSLGKGDLEGLRYFLRHHRLPIKAGVLVEGAQLGRLNYASHASLAAELHCTQRLGQDFGNVGAIEPLGEIIGRLHTLPMVARHQVKLVLGSMEAGTSFKTPARSARLRFLIQTESDVLLQETERTVAELLDSESMRNDVNLNLEVIARTRAGGLAPDHPLVEAARTAMKNVDIEPQRHIFGSAISSFVEHGIPAITLGISHARNLNQADETVAIAPMIQGLAQLIGVLLAIDGGCCDGH
jgi:hypothetical protein